MGWLLWLLGQPASLPALSVACWQETGQGHTFHAEIWPCCCGLVGLPSPALFAALGLHLGCAFGLPR